ALLDSFQATLVAGIADGRGVSAQAVRSWIDEGVTSARRARELGMIDRVAYEDEFLSPTHKPYRAGAHFLRSPLEPLRGGRIAVISLLGVIVPGKSRRSPLPLPLVGGQQAGSETLVNAFRAAEMDARTQAIVFYVDSGGGSALASDLIWREVARIRTRKPVIAVMGGVAGSGGYYVLTHANRVIAAPGTLTGSIGVLSGKFVLQQFNAKYGFHPEALQRGRFALTDSPSHPYDETERALVRRSIEEVYDRFTARVAEGRGLTRERVHEIGRGRIWSGQDALELGLVDELGDLSTGIACARELAGLPERAPVWNVEAPAKLLLPSSEDPTMLARTLAPLLRERVLLLEANSLRVG
ncbi:MAG TPA: signal peptide peptidase SppA, partial [Trueperaceae bacterium]